jgi:hypothetical protein
MATDETAVLMSLTRFRRERDGFITENVKTASNTAEIEPSRWFRTAKGVPSQLVNDHLKENVRNLTISGKPQKQLLLLRVALAVVHEIADRRCTRSRDAPIRLPTKSASTKRPFHLQHVANLRKFPGIMSSLFSTSTTMGWTF